MAEGDVELLRNAFERFAAGDLSAVEQTLDPQVGWHGADDPGNEGGCHNRTEALAFIRNALADGVSTELLDVHDAGERLVLILQREQMPGEDTRPEPHGELVTVRDGKVTEMVVFATVEDALAAARPAA